MRDYIQEHLLTIVCFWAVIMTVVALFTIAYAVTITEVSQDLVATVGFKDQDISDLHYELNEVNKKYTQLQLSHQELENNFNHCVQELPHGD